MANTVLTLESITKTFGEGEAQVDALKGVSLRIDAGEIVALLGPSGSGKSTLLSIAGALLKPTSGQLMLDGEDITSREPKDLTEFRLQKIGFIFQGSNLVSYLTGREQLLFIADLIGMEKDAASERADMLLESLGMAKRADHYPEELSGGERQRIAIGRSLMNSPRIILADEPTASLDSERGRQVVAMMRDEVHGSDRAAILVTHDERLIDLCDRVLRIRDGELVVDASSDEVDANGEPVEEDRSLLEKVLHR